MSKLCPFGNLIDENMLNNNLIYRTLLSFVFILLFHTGAMGQAINKMIVDFSLGELGDVNNITSPLSISGTCKVVTDEASNYTITRVGLMYGDNAVDLPNSNWPTTTPYTSGNGISIIDFDYSGTTITATFTVSSVGKYKVIPFAVFTDNNTATVYYQTSGSSRTLDVKTIKTITTLDATVASVSATLKATCALPGTVKFYVTETGLEYDAVNDGGGSYHFDLAGLNPSSTYHYKALVVNGSETKWGEEKVFTTDALSLTSTTGTRGYFKAVLNGSFTEHASLPESGFIYGTSTNLDKSNGQKISSVTYTGNDLTVPVSVTPSDNYYYVVYARHTNGEYYYSSRQTLSAPATRITPSCTLKSKSFYKASIEYALAIDYSSLDDDCTYGIVYSKSNNTPAVNGSDCQVKEIGSLDASSTTLPAVEALLTGLEENTTYYYRPYLLHNGSAIYGSLGSFTTTKLVAVTETADAVAYFHATIKGSIDIQGLDGVSVTTGFYFSESPVLTDANLIGTQDVTLPTAAKTEFSYLCTTLKANSTYYYRAYVKVGDKVLLGDLKDFKTLSFTPLTQDFSGSSFAATLNATDILKGNANINNGTESYVYGIAWGLSRSADADGVLLQKVPSASADAAGKYSIVVTNLTPGATLYYQAYVLFENKYYGGEIKSFSLGQFAPITENFSNQTYTSVRLSGKADLATAGVTTDKDRYTRGFFYSTSSTLTSSSDKVELSGTYATNSTADYTCDITNLRSGVNYYYCAYVCYNNGTSDTSDDTYYFGSTKTFSTSSFSPSTDPYTNLTYYKVTLNGTLGMATTTDLTNPPVSYGFVYSIVNNPVVNEANSDNVLWATSNTNGKFSSDIINTAASQKLVPGMTYYYRAVVRIETGANHFDYYYDNTATGVRSFTVPYLTPVTGTVENACFFSATLKGSVDFGGATPSEYVYGIAYSEYGSSVETQVPSTNIDASNVYSVSLTTLKANTVYNYRAYVIKNGTTTTYGTSHQFHTADVKPTTAAATSVSYFDATLNAKVVLPAEVTANTTDDCECNDYPVSSYKPAVTVGFIYSDNSNLNNVSPVEVTDVNKFDAAGKFSLNITNLTSDRTYYFKSFVKNGDSYYYGETLTLHTSTFVPTCSDPLQGYFQETLKATMPAPELLNAPSANLSDVCGFIVSTNTNPTLSNSTEHKCTAADYVKNGANYTGEFSLTVPNLVPGAHYYYRAFVKNAGNYYFSNIHDFETKPFTVKTGTVETTYYNAKLNGELNIVGETSNYTYGFVYSTSRTPSATSAGSVFVNSATSGEVSALTPNAGKSEFNSTLTSLTQDVTYYYRAYVKDNNNQYYYATDISQFILSSFKPTTNPVGTVTYFTAAISGTVDMSGIATGELANYTKGFFLSADPGKLNSSVSESIVPSVDQTSFSVTANVLAGTKYYFCAYVKYEPSGSTTPVYYTGNTEIFTTPSCVTSSSVDAVPKSFSATLSATLAATASMTPGSYDYGFIVSESSAFDNVDLSSSIYPANNIVGSGTFSHEVPNLVPSHTYYYLPYIKVGGVMYYDKSAWGNYHFVTNPLNVVTDGSSNLKYFSANLSGKVANFNDLPATYEYGFVYTKVSDSSNGQLVDNEPRTFVKVGDNATPLTSSTPFTHELTGLESNTRYYFAAVVRVNGQIYKSFNPEQTLYTFRTVDVTPLTYDAQVGSFVATFNGTLKDATPATSGYDYGFVYSTDRETVNSGTQVLSTSSPNTITLNNESISSVVSPLVAGKRYYYRAFALANSHYYWGNIVEFQTLDFSPTTKTPSSLTFFSATIPCNVNFTGVNVADYTYGIIVGDNPRITAVNAFRKLQGSGIVTTQGPTYGDYSVTVDGLETNKHYYCRAYVLDNQGNYVYGNAVAFTTEALQPETLGADIATRTATTITIHGSAGDASLNGTGQLANYGFVYSTSSVLNLSNGTSVSYVHSDPSVHEGITSITNGAFSAGLTGLTGSTNYYYRTFVTYNVLESDNTTSHSVHLYGEVKSFTTEDECLVSWSSQKEVDLDLPSGTKWATCNVGATQSYESGDFFAWASPSTSTSFDKDSYKLGRYNVEALKVYKESGYTLPSGSSYTTTLAYDGSNDCALAIQGTGWAIPTPADWNELIENCNWEIKQVKGVYGFKVSSKTHPEKSIFLPAAGYKERSSLQGTGTTGGYWTNEISADCPDFAHLLEFFIYIDETHPARTGELNRPYVQMNSNFRYYGRTVRAVKRP